MVAELPRFRSADQIDITAEQLKLLKEIFNSIVDEEKGIAFKATWFHELRKNP